MTRLDGANKCRADYFNALFRDGDYSQDAIMVC
jgi:hypothetical protein